MYLRKSLLFSSFLLQLLCSGQTLTVVDRVSRETLPGVVLYSKQPFRQIVTNKKGQADIAVFRGADSVFFNLVTYKEQVYSYDQLSQRSEVELPLSGVFLEEIVVSANRWEEQATENPNLVEKLTAKEIRLQNPQTSAAILEQGGLVYVQRSQMAGGSPLLRGFATSRVLLVVDGVRMNNAIFRSGNVQNVISVDANAVRSSEVLFGPGAVIYGSDAIGGVIDFHLLDPEFSDSAGSLLKGGSLFTRYSSANSEKTIHADFRAGTTRWSSLSSISFSDYDHLRAGKYGHSDFLRPWHVQSVGGRDTAVWNDDPRLQLPSAYSQLNLMQKLALRTGSKSTLEYGFYYSLSSDAPRYDRLYLDQDGNGKPDYAEWYYGPQKWMMNRLAFRSTAGRRLYDQLRMTAAHQQFAESRHDRRFNSKTLRNQYELVDAISLNVDFDKKTSGRSHLFFGGESVYNMIGSEAARFNTESGKEIPIQSRYPNGSTWQLHGLYASMKHHISETTIIHTGLRASLYSMRATFDTSYFPFPFTEAVNSSGALNGSAGVVWLRSKDLRVFLNGATGFRAPNMDDMGKVFESQPGIVIVPNRDLKPEYAWNCEAGFVKTVGQSLKAELVGYYTLLTNAMARRDYTYKGSDSLFYDGVKSRVMAIQNIGRANVYGIQAGLEIRLLNGFRLLNKISYQRGFELSADSAAYYPLPHVAPLYGRSSLQYSRRKLLADMYVVYNRYMSYEDLSLNDRIDNAVFARDRAGQPFVPGWYTLNLKVAYFPNKHFTISAGVENITDRLYRPFASGISAPGRNFIASIRYRI